MKERGDRACSGLLSCSREMPFGAPTTPLAEFEALMKQRGADASGGYRAAIALHSQSYLWALGVVSRRRNQPKSKEKKRKRARGVEI